MTPAIRLLKKQRVAFSLHQYVSEQSNVAYGAEAAQKLMIDSSIIFKTLVVMLEGGELVNALIPVSEALSMKRMAQCFAVKKAKMADKKEVLRVTGYVLGCVSPLAQKND